MIDPIFNVDMDTNLNKMLDRVLDSIANTNLNDIFDKLSKIKEPTIITGCGGSSVVGTFLAKVLNEKNHIIADFKFPRELKYMDLTGYKNVMSISYSGRNIGVNVSFENDLNKYLFSGNTKDGVIPLQYTVNDEELSFVSVAGSFIPLSIILLYYKNDIELVKEILTTEEQYDVDNSNIYEIMTSNKSISACAMLESTMVEGGLAAPVIHEKYNYCHGRLMLNEKYHNPLIYFDDDSDLDELFKKEVLPNYRKIITINRKYNDSIIDDYYQTYLCLLLCMQIAKKQGKDICIKDVPPVSDVIYMYKGNL